MEKVFETQPEAENKQNETLLTPQELTADNNTWYAIKLYSLRLKNVLEYLKEQGLTCFVPMEFTYTLRGKQLNKPILQPVVHNLVFVKKDRDEKQVQKIITSSNFKLAIVRRSLSDRAYYEIPARQMLEFMLMCSPEIAMRKYITESEAKLKAGTKVEVRHGALKGLSGRLVRSSSKYFLLKEVPGMAVMVKVSRWCCVAVE